MANTVKVKSYIDNHLEKTAAGTITPGMLIEITSEDKFQAHSTDSGPAITIFAIEDEYQGRPKTTNYTTGERTIGWVAQRGDVVEAILDGDSTASIAVGDKVRSAGNGKLEKFSPLSGDSGANTGSNEIVGQAMEAATGGERFKVLIW